MVKCGICGKLTGENTKLRCYKCNTVYCSDTCATIGNFKTESNVCKVD